MRYRIITFLASLTLLVGCNDFLEQSPDNRATIDTPEKVGELLVYAYPTVNHQAFCTIMSDNATDKLKSKRKHESNKNAYYWEDFIRDDQDSPVNFWNGCYAAIKQANHALAIIEPLIIDGTVPAEYASYYGEALLCRAYCHFMLVNLWSPQYDPATAGTDLGIPYVKEPETVVIKDYNRGTVASVYANIEADLTTGIKYVDDYANDNLKLHWNKRAVNTFAARFFSMKGEYEKVLSHTGEVFDEYPLSLLRPVNSTYKQMDIKERIPLWGRTTEACNFLITPQYSNWFLNFYGSYQYGMSYDLYNYVFKGRTNNSQILQEPFVAVKRDRTGFSDTWAWDGLGSDPDYFMPKWGYHTEKDGLNSETGYYMIMNVIFDAEEALFLRMEAQAMLGNYELVRNGLDIYLSTRILNYNPEENAVTEENVKKRYAEEIAKYKLNPFYPIPDEARPYMNCLYDLRRKEFFYTGMRWFDHRRFNTTVTHYVGESDKIVLSEKDVRKQLQIPTSAAAYGLESNPR